jgi:hypothetical protein
LGLAVDVLEVLAGGPLGDTEAASDLYVGETGGRQMKNLQFAAAE